MTNVDRDNFERSFVAFQNIFLCEKLWRLKTGPFNKFFKMGRLKVAVICSSNMNRSMEAHSVLSKRNFTVSSYGTGDKIKIPGKSPREPNVYPFGTTYKEIYKDLINKDKKLYTGGVGCWAEYAKEWHSFVIFHYKCVQWSRSSIDRKSQCGPFYTHF